MNSHPAQDRKTKPRSGCSYYMKGELTMYFTVKTTTPMQQITFDDLFNNFNQIKDNMPPEYGQKFFRTYTRWISEENYNAQQLWDMYNLQHMVDKLKGFDDEINALLTQDLKTMYTTFYIPKHTGGLRQIDAPSEELKSLLRKIKDTFEWHLKFIPHNAAYAYTKGRSTKEALLVHQQNQSKWFLKLDIKDFFPSCNYNFIMQQISQIFPFNLLLTNTDAKPIIEKIIKLSLLENALPQGTPMSPLLTNIIMLPIDYTIQNRLQNFDKQSFKYTRYADDLLISCRYTFNWQLVQQEINKIFKEHNAPFKIKTEKTRYGSANGRNWNLGLMLNKDNKITIGHKQKQRLKAMLFNFFRDLTNGTSWSILDTQTLIGQLSYARKIEPEYTNFMLERLENKFNKNFQECAKRILKQVNQ